jgi:hypothetical protein
VGEIQEEKLQQKLLNQRQTSSTKNKNASENATQAQRMLAGKERSISAVKGMQTDSVTIEKSNGTSLHKVFFSVFLNRDKQ